MQLSEIYRRVVEYVAPPPKPPQMLSGVWTPEEREFVQFSIDENIAHCTQGRGIRRLDEYSRSDYYRYMKLVAEGTAEELKRDWLYLKFRYGINAMLPWEVRR